MVALLSHTGAAYGSRKRISFSELAHFPQFLRFNEVRLIYSQLPDIGTIVEPVMSISERCFHFQMHLQALKPALSDSNSLSFNCRVRELGNHYHFNGHSQLIDHLRDELLPLCSTFRRYEFALNFTCCDETATNVLASILQMSQISRCQNVEIKLYPMILLYLPLQFPVEVISGWLTGSSEDGANQKMENRLLSIYSFNISNSQEMWNHLEQVNNVMFACICQHLLRLEAQLGEEF